MRRWLDPKWYAFLWQRKDRRGPAVVLVLLLGALAAGGYAAASSMNRSDTSVGIVRVEALKQKVRVHGRERVVTRYVTLATTDVARPSTVFRTRLVTRPLVKTVQAAPVVRRRLVYVTAKGSTVTRRQTLTRVQTQTQLATQTNFETVTQPTTVVESKTVTRRITTTAPAQTVTVTGAILTVTITKTVTRTTTVTAPATTTK
jgi:hypothetical protein